MSEEKLKTLEDFELEWYWIDGQELIIKELREEAKKWTSQIQAKIKEKEGKFDDFGIDLGMEPAEQGGAIISFIKTFFNLEEEK